MKREIEIYKIGNRLPAIPSRREIGKKPIMMVVSDAGEPCDTYVRMLREHCSEEYAMLKASKSIIGSPKMGMRGHLNVCEGHSIKGKEDAPPMEGQPYYIDEGSWRTSTVERIIEGCVLITKNSIYALHDPTERRDKKLEQLGI